MERNYATVTLYMHCVGFNYLAALHSSHTLCSDDNGRLTTTRTAPSAMHVLAAYTLVLVGGVA